MKSRQEFDPEKELEGQRHFGGSGHRNFLQIHKLYHIVIMLSNHIKKKTHLQS